MTSRVPSSWPHTLTLLLLLSGWIFAWYWDTAISMFEIWMRSGTYAHAFVVLPISFWLIWRKRDVLSSEEPSGSFLPLIPIAVSVFSWLLGELTAVNALRQFSFVALLVFSSIALIGPSVSKRVMFPLAFLFFSVPFGDFIIPQLMDWTAEFTVRALRATGIPVYQEGLQFVIPSGNWSVVEACSGIRYIIASVTIGTLFAYLNYVSLQRRLIFVAISAIVPLVANWLRAYMIVMLGHISSNKLAAGVDHLIYGWVFFGIVIIVMFMIGARWSEPEVVATRSSPHTTGNPLTVKGWLAATFAALLTAAGPLLFDAINGTDRAMQPTLTALPPPVGWVAQPSSIDFEPSYAAPSARLHSAFAKDGKDVGVHIYYYHNQNDRRKMVTSTNSLVSTDNPDWKLVAQKVQSVNHNGLPAKVRVATLIGTGNSRDVHLLAWYWYWINGKQTTSDAMAKIYTALARLRGKGDDSAVVIFYALEDSGSASIESFAADAGASINHLLLSASQQ